MYNKKNIVYFNLLNSSVEAPAPVVSLERPFMRYVCAVQSTSHQASVVWAVVAGNRGMQGGGHQSCFVLPLLAPSSDPASVVTVIVLLFSLVNV